MYEIPVMANLNFLPSLHQSSVLQDPSSNHSDLVLKKHVLLLMLILLLLNLFVETVISIFLWFIWINDILWI